MHERCGHGRSMATIAAAPPTTQPLACYRARAVRQWRNPRRWLKAPHGCNHGTSLGPRASAACLSDPGHREYRWIQSKAKYNEMTSNSCKAWTCRYLQTMHPRHLCHNPATVVDSPDCPKIQVLSKRLRVTTVPCAQWEIDWQPTPTRQDSGIAHPQTPKGVDKIARAARQFTAVGICSAPPRTTQRLPPLGQAQIQNLIQYASVHGLQRTTYV